MTLKLEVKGMGTGEAPDLRWYYCEDESFFSAVVQIEIGAKNSKNSDNFYLRVVTLASLLQLEPDGEVVTYGNMLILKSFSYEALLTWVQNTVDKCSAATWDQSVNLLRQYLRWEFDYCDQALK